MNKDSSDLFFYLRRRRLALGLSQASLANKAQVSLPTIQNLESGRANLSWDILSRVLTVLGLSWNLQQSPLNWELLASQGVPLSSQNAKSRDAKRDAPTNGDFEVEIRKALAELVAGGKNMKLTREWESLLAYVWALRDHYPSRYKRYCGNFAINDYLVSSERHGRLIKLRRLALAAMENF